MNTPNKSNDVLSIYINKLIKSIVALLIVVLIDQGLDKYRKYIDTMYPLDMYQGILDKSCILTLLEDWDWYIIESYLPDSTTRSALRRSIINDHWLESKADALVLSNLIYIWLKYGNPRISDQNNIILNTSCRPNNRFGTIYTPNYDLDLLIAELSHQPQVIQYSTWLYAYFGVRDNIARPLTDNTGMEYVAHDCYEPAMMREVFDADVIQEFSTLYNSIDLLTDHTVNRKIRFRNQRTYNILWDSFLEKLDIPVNQEFAYTHCYGTYTYDDFRPSDYKYETEEHNKWVKIGYILNVMKQYYCL